jgi:CDP-diglyceride synthetase
MTERKLVFIRRFASTVTLWSVALWIILSGFELGFLFLIGGLGLAALWEYYKMLDRKGLPNFKYIGMLCGLLLSTGSFYYFRKVGPEQSYDFEVATLLFFMLVVLRGRCSRRRATFRRWRRWPTRFSGCFTCRGSSAS